MSMFDASTDLVARLRRLDTCAVSDALDAAGVPGAVTGILPVWTGPSVAGRVVTVDIGPAGSGGPKVHLGARAIEAAGADDVIVVAHHGRTDVAGWGGLLSTAGKARGVAGVVVDGASRDIDEARELGFPVFARAAVPVTARGRVQEVAFNEEVDVAGLGVRPGDYVVADASGVAFVGASVAESVIETAEQFAARERALAEALRGGGAVTEVMGSKYEGMLERDER